MLIYAEENMSLNEEKTPTIHLYLQCNIHVFHACISRQEEHS